MRSTTAGGDDRDGEAPLGVDLMDLDLVALLDTSDRVMTDLEDTLERVARQCEILADDLGEFDVAIGTAADLVPLDPVD